MPPGIENRYFAWLCEQVGAVSSRNPERSYLHLMWQLHSREFVWLVANDDNRVEDGKELRYEFINAKGTGEFELPWFELGCSVLEMLVALARRASFQANREPADWFWFFMQMLGLQSFSDREWNRGLERTVDRVLDQLIYRTYSPTGRGGLFPLQNPAEDQRKVELSYQMAAYLIETHQY